MIIVKKEM